MEKLNKKHKDNFDDDNKMEEYKFDPNDYCRFCSGHLRGIRHIVDCRRIKREGYSPVRVVLEKREDVSKNKLVKCQRKRGVGPQVVT